MNILFMSLSDYQTINFHGIYPDLLRQFMKHGDKVYIVSPSERRSDERGHIIEEPGAIIAKIKIWNMQKTNVIEKGLSMLTIDQLFIRAIKKYFGTVKFGLILYPTPPITLLRAVEYVKKRDGARTYLLLKDIFPQNAVDIGFMSTIGIRGLLYRHFRKQEKKLYGISDCIGCMSPANVEYILKHNHEVDPQRVEVCPNTIDLIDMSCTQDERIEIRSKYGIPLDKTVFVYGGNLGKPQDIPFIIECMRKCQNIKESYFLIVGDGTEYAKLEKYVNGERPQNVKLMKRLPKEDYDRMIGACDIGLIFLDHRFTIPNFPSRLLAYMQAKLPVLACTDSNTDIGNIIIDNGFGWWCESNNVINFTSTLDRAINSDIKKMGRKSFAYLLSNYTSEISYQIIIKNFKVGSLT